MTNYISLLKNNRIFSPLSDEMLETVAAGLQTRSLRAGEVLFHYQAPGNEMILVEDGKIAIYMPEAEHPQAGQAIRIFQPGSILGEMALIDGGLRSTSARAETDATIATLDAATFRQLLSAHTEVATGVMSGLNERIRYTTSFIEEISKWVHRVAEGQYQNIEMPANVKEDSLAALAADFVMMASNVRKREESLKQEIAQLRIVIDEKKRNEEASQITQSEFFSSLKDKLRAMRSNDDDD